MLEAKIKSAAREAVYAAAAGDTENAVSWLGEIDRLTRHLTCIAECTSATSHDTKRKKGSVL